MKILVLVSDYPDNKNNASLMYAHTRNKYYYSKGAEVSVINFKATSNYHIDNIEVLTLQSFYNDKNIDDFNIIVSHAPNLRNHYRFFKKIDLENKNLVFFFHGHEIMKINEEYPKPYPYVKKENLAKKLIQMIYDKLKILLWKKFFEKSKNNYSLIFVSEWMKKMFINNLNIDTNHFKHDAYIIPNSVGKIWESGRYSIDGEKRFDFITIRSNLDESKYCIDLVANWAINNPEKTFLVVGRGAFFDEVNKISNLTLINKSLDHTELVKFVNDSKVALMPTRLDAQGVMACELATYGIPLITSNIEICHYVFENFPNVFYIDNIKDIYNLSETANYLIGKYSFDVDKRFFAENTIEEEWNVFLHMLNN